MAFLLLFAPSISALAGSTDHLHMGMNDHMKLMLTVKEGVPEEYRIMERTPIMPTEESIQQGQKLYLQNCSVCHGENGNGKGPAALALNPPPANFLEKKHSSIYGPGEKYWIIGNGTGETGMPQFSQLTPVERWHLVNYIFDLQEKHQ